ncbi:hypothetical protein AWH56_005250 [Anaerobacillus isosaccharinicus]|uniref:Uncharacterized protein n=1 Tax=Anaerobacillus isosaccharinicus TaxID=1532552 RepID=A0A1S2L9P8_9BACI|nr:hypothetical protein [Anaerobacillus isosaccharinicus]MBA5584567.1 hypothetical protein [Anaerobacillus isosaccharinicus]QOY37050.1 hypothetical protein AWH56_005250 [Anaerobacillus isosaccharinicus]
MKDKKYGKIEFTLGGTIEQAVNELLNYKRRGKLVYGKFNGVTLYSDTVTIDSAYREITGKSKAEFDEYIN